MSKISLTNLIFEPLANHPETLKQLAAWFQAQWGYINPTRTLASREKELKASIKQNDEVPLVYVVMCEQKLIGSISLLEHDMSTHMELTPWIASVYIAENYRGQGIGSWMLEKMLTVCKKLSCTTLYLFTPDKAAWYKKRGWEIIKVENYKKDPVTIMQLSINNDGRSLCPCCSGRAFQNCCKPYINAKKPAPTPEALMRSRYTAYTQANIEYVFDTMQEAALKNADRQESLKWSKSVKWRKLEVISSGYKKNAGHVEFKAHFIENNKHCVMHELSTFKKTAGHWYYVDGQTPTAKTVIKKNKTGRNDLCHCGSGKKYKKCCLAIS